jgi:hypothetical protein
MGSKLLEVSAETRGFPPRALGKQKIIAESRAAQPPWQILVRLDTSAQKARQPEVLSLRADDVHRPNANTHQEG